MIAATSESAENFRQLLENRWSCRGFLDREVCRATIESTLQMAQRTASWSNVQPWQVHIASAKAASRLATSLLEAGEAERASDLPFPATFAAPYQLRRQECGRQLYEAVGVVRGDKEAYGRQMRENFRFFGAPHVAIITTDPGLGVYGVVDVGGYVQVLLLALRAHGLACIAQAALAVYSPVVRRVLDIPAERQIVCGISFGYEDEKHPANSFRTNRAELDQVVTWKDA